MAGTRIKISENPKVKSEFDDKKKPFKDNSYKRKSQKSKTEKKNENTEKMRKICSIDLAALEIESIENLCYTKYLGSLVYESQRKEDSLISEIIALNSDCKITANSLKENEILKKQDRLIGFVNSRNKRIYDDGAWLCRFQFTYKPYDRLIIGIGEKTPFTSALPITLHNTYGIPYIPSSALKGVIRNCWISEEFHCKEEDALKDPDFRFLFGSAEKEETLEELSTVSRGNLIFFDSFSARVPNIQEDVMTPHYPEYYSSKGKGVLREGEDPKPIKFPVICNTEFSVYIVSRKEIEVNLRMNFEKIVKIAFNEYGIGAKTSVGYGLGKID